MFVFRLSQHAKAVVGSTKTAGRTQNLPLRADASGALQSKLQSSGAERHLAPRGVAEARATRWVAISQPAGQETAPPHPPPPNGHCPRAWEILPFQLIVETEYFPFKAGRAGA